MGTSSSRRSIPCSSELSQMQFEVSQRSSIINEFLVSSDNQTVRIASSEKKWVQKGKKEALTHVDIRDYTNSRG
uniref:Ovule protein n=1 Tax=Loa loa TaxID=7209 RepID=A0A1I7V9H6_LOALO